jgi:hypothetical protein
MTEFVSAGWFEIGGVGWEAAVSLDRDTHDFAHLLQRRVTIDGAHYICIAVNCFEHPPPWRTGEPIGLVVKVRQAALTET